MCVYVTLDVSGNETRAIMSKSKNEILGRFNACYICKVEDRTCYTNTIMKM